MANNQILPFGTAAGANVLSPSEYLALASRTGGFQSGVAKSKELNTVWRQSSFMAAMIAQFTADLSGLDVLDDGAVAALNVKFQAALLAFIQSKSATETDAGTLKLASLVDANDATNNTRAVTPAGLRAFIGGRPGRLKRVRVYDTVGIELYSASSGTQAVFVEVQGGGGSGGSTPTTTSGQSAIAGGGGGGGYSSSWLTTGFNGVIITVGQGGPPVSGGGAPGNPGGLSSFGSLLSASGGSGGSGAPTTASAPIVTGGGSGGVGSGGNVLNAFGGQAHSSFALSNGTSLNGGAGGSSQLGGGGGQTSAGNQPGNAATTYGAGGGGCATGQNQAATNGGRGFKGAVIVWEYE